MSTQVPDTNEIKINPLTGTLMRDGVPSILNPDDANALEAALRIKDEHPDTEVDVLSMGPEQACYALRECLADGRRITAYLLSGRAFGGADTCSTSTTLAYGVRKIGEVRLYLHRQTGQSTETRHRWDRGWRQRLGLPIATYVQNIREIREKTVIVERRAGGRLSRFWKSIVPAF